MRNVYLNISVNIIYSFAANKAILADHARSDFNAEIAKPTMWK